MRVTSVFRIIQNTTQQKQHFITKKLLQITVIAISLASLTGLSIVMGAPAPEVSVNDYSQCTNDDGDGYAAGDTGCRWTNGNIQSNNSIYHEDDATVQRLLVEDVTIGSTHTVTFKYGSTKGAKHAYDFLTTDTFSELAPNTITNADMCDGAASSKLPSCSSLTPNVSSLIPTDPLAGGFDVARANRFFKIRNGTITNVSVPTVVSGSYAGDSETAITVSFTVPSNCADKYTVGSDDVPVCAALISFGAHISKGSDWGVGTTAVNIPGSPYHVALDAIDSESIGQRDNQMQAAAIILPSTITIHKVTDPATDTTTSFPFTTSGTGYTGFSLTGGGQNQQSVNPGTYSVTETNPAPAYALSNLSCTASGTGTSVTPNTGTRTASITIGATGGGSVDCIYTNTLQKAHLTLVKTVTNDNGGTAATTDWTLTGNGPTPISGITGSVAVTTAEIDSGSYTLSENSGPSGYTGGTYSCVKNGGSPAVSNSITLAPGDNATCTVNNNDNAPSLILNKIVVNNDGGTAVESAWTLNAAGPTPLSGPGAAGAADVTSGAGFSAGTYTLSETGGPTGYAVGDWNCVGGNQNGALITVALGETATCTIINNDIQPRLTLTKIVVNDNGGNAVVSDFPLFVNATGVTSGTQNGFSVGSYTASETNQPGYTASSWTGDCAVNGTISLAPGDVKACTITNDDQPASITLIKSVINNSGGTAGADDFGISVGGSGVLSGSTTVVNSNTAVVLNEVGLAGYSFVSLTGNAKCPTVLGGSTATLNEGENITCTITNDDVAGSLKIVKNTVGDNGTFNFTVAGPTPSTPSIITASNTGSVGPNNVNAGSYSVAETVPAGWSLTSATCDDGTSAFSVATMTNITVALDQDVVCTFTNTKRANLTIVKDAQPNDLIDFSFTGSGPLGSFLLDDDEGVADIGQNGDTHRGASKAFSNLVSGSYTVSETMPNSFWTFGGVTCLQTGTPTPYTSITTSGSGVTVNLTPGADVTCTFVNLKASPTRTQGFWQNHTAYTSTVFTAHPGMFVGVNVAATDLTHRGILSTNGQLFGAYFSNIAKKTDNKQRVAVDKARMVLLQQLVTAKLNCAAFGCASSVQAMITAADNAYAGSNTTAMSTSTGLLDAYNNSGDTITIGNAGKATPADSKAIANLVFWDTP